MPSRRSFLGNYKELQYIESTGTQYIDTGVIGSSTVNLEFVFQYVSWTVNVNLYGSRSVSSNYYYVTRTASAYLHTYNKSQGSVGISPDYNKHTIKIDAGSFYYDGTLKLNYTGSFTGEYSLLLFAASNAGTAAGISNVKIYSTKIWDNGTLVRDFIPVLDYNNIPCMFDKVNQQFYYNAGTGTFSYSF